jgi:exopolysaccharide biosynthesis polyprenyl glycosylphosphotransferase
MTTKFVPESTDLDLRSSGSPAFIKFRKGAAVGWLRAIMLIVLDGLLTSIAWKLAVAYGTYVASSWTANSWTANNGLRFLSLILVISISTIAVRGLYRAGNDRRNYLELAKAISLSNILLLLTAFPIGPNYYVSRTIFLLFWFFNIVLVCAGRFSFDLATNFVRKQGILRHPVVLICKSEEQEKSIKLIQSQNCYELRKALDSSSLDKAELEDTLAALQDLGIAEAFVSWNTVKHRLHICWYFQSAGIMLRLLQLQHDPFPGRFIFWFLDGVPCLNVPTSTLIGGTYWVKRCFDFFCSTILVLLLSPLFILIAVLIQIDSPGSIFFRQSRVGLQGRTFKIYKFRTMVSNADRLQADLEVKNEMSDGVLFKMKNDPRVTRIGRFLRRYSLDELPQLFNVLAGEMSLVGPRPLPIRDVARFKEEYFIRQKVLPGITGLWQVSGRSNIDNFEAAVDLDIQYIVDWSLWLDLKILLKTVRVVCLRTGAY